MEKNISFFLLASGSKQKKTRKRNLEKIYIIIRACFFLRLDLASKFFFVCRKFNGKKPFVLGLEKGPLGFGKKKNFFFLPLSIPNKRKAAPFAFFLSLFPPSAQDFSSF